jgi:hypothetical protein
MMCVATGMQSTDMDVRKLTRGAIPLHKSSGMQLNVRYEANCAAAAMDHFSPGDDRVWQPRTRLESGRKLT